MSGNGFCPWCGIDERSGSHVCPVADLVTPALIRGVREEDERCNPAQPDPNGTLTPNGAEFVVPPPSFVRNLQDRFAALASERDHLRAQVAEECRLNAMGQERELKLRARVTELEAEVNILRNPSDGRCMEIGALRVWFKKLETERDRLAAELKEARGAAHQHLRRYHDTLAERDAARAECQRLGMEAITPMEIRLERLREANQRLEAQAARMREALECIETGHDPSTGEPNASATIAKQALAETDAGALVQGLVEALGGLTKAANVMLAAELNGVECFRIDQLEQAFHQGKEALDAWKRDTAGSV